MSATEEASQILSRMPSVTEPSPDRLASARPPFPLGVSPVLHQRSRAMNEAHCLAARSGVDARRDSLGAGISRNLHLELIRKKKPHQAAAFGPQELRAARLQLHVN